MTSTPCRCAKTPIFPAQKSSQNDPVNVSIWFYWLLTRTFWPLFCVACVQKKINLHRKVVKMWRSTTAGDEKILTQTFWLFSCAEMRGVFVQLHGKAVTIGWWTAFCVSKCRVKRCNKINDLFWPGHFDYFSVQIFFAPRTPCTDECWWVLMSSVCFRR